MDRALIITLLLARFAGCHGTLGPFRRSPIFPRPCIVAFRQLGGEPDAPPLSPPWFLAGAEAVWQRIGETERALRALVRDVYATKFGDAAAPTIQAKLPERERETLTRALRTRPPGSDPLTVVDYLYLGQLPALLFASEVWAYVESKLIDAADARRRLHKS